MNSPAGHLEWLETNRFGSFALGCVDRRLRRKYHALLTLRQPGNGDPWNVLADVREHLTQADSHALLLDPTSGESEQATLEGFERTPHATHRYRAFGIEIERRVRLASSHEQVELRYRFRGVREPVRLELEPLLRCRPLHELTYENPFLDGSLAKVGAHGASAHGASEDAEADLRMTPYQGMPPLAFRVRCAGLGPVQPRLVQPQPAQWLERGAWHKQVSYASEAERGYQAHEDLFSPGRFVIELAADAEITLLVAVEGTATPEAEPETYTPPLFAAKLERACGQFRMQLRAGQETVVAGYPWFGPWGRDTLIALPGMHLACDDLERTCSALQAMLDARINGLVPNIPALGGVAASTASVDATLLFVRAVQWLGERAGKDAIAVFMPAVCELLEALADARDPRMHLDEGIGVWTEPGPWALTWMDAMVDGRPVTPRAGYAVDVDALAYNAAQFALAWAESSDGHRPRFARTWRARLKDAEPKFLARYWDPARGHLADSHDGRRADGALRPNQLWALGLPFRAVSHDIAKLSLDAVTRELLVPAGLRTLAPGDAAYRGQYRGAQPERDRAYHQGTVWPWLLGIYADAVRETHGRQALEPRLSPVLSFLARHLDHEGCIGQISEIFDGDAPHLANGTPAQAWSASELYRVWRMLHSAG